MSVPESEGPLPTPLTVEQLLGHLAALVELGHGGCHIYTPTDEEGNGYNQLWYEPEVRDYDDEDYVEEDGWHEDIEEGKVVIL